MSQLSGKDIHSLSITELLSLGEGLASSQHRSSFDEGDNDSDSASSLEEVEIPDEPSSETVKKEYTLPADGVVVKIDLPIGQVGRKKKKFDFEASLRRKLSRRARETQLMLHKSNVVFIIASHRFLNKTILNNMELQALALSLVPSANCYPGKRTDMNYLEKLVLWFSKKFKIDPERPEKEKLHDAVADVISTRRSPRAALIVYSFVVLARAIGLTARLVCNFRPVPPKSVNEFSKTADSSASKSAEAQPNADEKSIATPAKGSQKSTKTSVTKKSSSAELLRSAGKEKPRNQKSEPTRKSSQASSRKSPKTKNQRNDEDSSPEVIAEKKRVPKKINRQILSSDDEKPGPSGTQGKPDKVRDIWSEVFLEEEEFWVSVDVFAGKVHCVREILGKVSKPLSYIVGFNNDGTLRDVLPRYEPMWATSLKKNRAEDGWWRETIQPFLEPKSRRRKAEDKEFEQSVAEQPLPSSIGAYKNHPLFALDRHLLKFEAIYPHNAKPLGNIRGESVYPRSCVHKLHSKETWLKEALVIRDGEKPYKIVAARPKYDRLSGEMLKAQPLELFGKWQTEPFVPPVAENGIVPRNNFGNVEKALVIRDGEKPYKIVAARPKYDRLSGEMLKAQPLELFGKWQTEPFVPPAQPLELFGKWQTEPFVPPVAENGIVPRNNFGNVELFKPCMLPVGCVHMNLPNLNKIARKLKIDCAQAMVGWDFHGGWSHPVYDGFVVCQEYEELLQDAYDQEMAMQEKKDEDKRLTRIYKNWRRLVRGLLIRERIKCRYINNFDEDSAVASGSNHLDHSSEDEAQVKKACVEADGESSIAAKKRQLANLEKQLRRKPTPKTRKNPAAGPKRPAKPAKPQAKKRRTISPQNPLSSETSPSSSEVEDVEQVRKAAKAGNIPKRQTQRKLARKSYKADESSESDGDFSAEEESDGDFKKKPAAAPKRPAKPAKPQAKKRRTMSPENPLSSETSPSSSEVEDVEQVRKAAKAGNIPKRQTHRKLARKSYKADESSESDGDFSAEEESDGDFK
ncbi:unnamed protein product [Notodromas monacha]|uniref:DNA repair protein complementing XP-C cells n=1 Tax=Notodromas monacha TaxID=399045 RepID=A0A7R9BMN9_9CRUS|nr:unnamed protein product [Notodromas monacha]CAG0918329.1 unnamed protein product [Notodromas monacha]